LSFHKYFLLYTQLCKTAILLFVSQGCYSSDEDAAHLKGSRCQKMISRFSRRFPRITLRLADWQRGSASADGEIFCALLVFAAQQWPDIRAPRRDGRLGFSSRRLIVYNVEWDR